MSRKQSPEPVVATKAAPSAAERALRAEMTGRYKAHVDEARRLAQERKRPNPAVLSAAIRTETHECRQALPRDLELEHLTRVLLELEQEALAQLQQVMAIARLRLRDEPEEVAQAGTPRRLAMRQRPTIVANMAVEKQAAEGGLTLTWQPAAGVSEWTVRVEERRDDRSSYEAVETLTLPGPSTATTVSLGERSRRVTLIGRRRDGRVLRRALISALTSDSWREQWQRKPSAG
jgi:hypothetical protein